MSGISIGEINEGSSSFGVAIPSEQGELVVPPINDGEPLILRECSFICV